MSTNRYTVETRGSGVIILGAPTHLKNSLIEELLLNQLHAVYVQNIGDLESLQESFDPDQIVYFDDDQTREWLKNSNDGLLTEINHLVEQGLSTLISVCHEGRGVTNSPFITTPKRITYSDYVGAKDLESNTISAWIDSIINEHTIAVPGDGLGEFGLISQNDLVRLLSLAILQSNRNDRDIALGNPAPMSYLNLAYLIRTHFPFKIKIDFEDDDLGGGEKVYDSSIYEQSLRSLGGGVIAEPQSTLIKYLTTQKFETKEVELPNDNTESNPIPPIAPSRVVISPPQIKVPTRSLEQSKPAEKIEPKQPLLRKLTPLRTNNPVFVPLQEKKTRLTIPRLPRPKIRPVGPPRVGVIIGRGIVIALALYLGTLAFASTISLLSLKQIWSSLSTSNLPRSNPLSSFSLTYLEANWLVLTHLPIISESKKISEISLLFDAYGQAISIFNSASELGASTQELTHYIFGSGNSDIAQVISSSRLQAEELSQKLSLLDGLLPSTPPSVIPVKYHDQYTNSKAKIAETKRTITTAKAILATTPDLIGLGGRRKYAVLFQNNMELRATGGFIGSFAIMSFENGRLYDMPIYDVYDADGQLKGHVEPPLAIKNILGEANWYLRDSNFDPDFPTSARRAEWFIKKTLNQDLDGTIAVNVNTLTTLLEASGPIKVDDYDETITAGNLYERAQFHAEVNFFPGSTQKKEFLSTVANALFAQLPSMEGNEGLKLASALSKSVEEKDTLISVVNASSDQIFQTLGWNGHLTDFPCPVPTNCHKDYAMVVDSNFGVNKANFFIERNIEQVITFDKNLSVNHSLRIAYQNNSTSTAWPAGSYKNYQRIYLPFGSTINAVKIDGRQLDAKAYEITSEHNKTIIAHLLTVPISSKALVEIEYATPQLPQEDQFLYTWYWQKQSGTSKKDNLTVYLNYPLYLKPSIVSPSADLATQQLKFNMVNDADRRLTVKFSK